MNFWPEFVKLKTSVGGNREHFHYEESFGMPREEAEHITPPNAHNKRILSEMEFAIRLNEEHQGKFDECVGKALHFLSSEMEKEGVLTKTVCQKAEEMLLPCSAEAKQYKLILAGHAHIDMDWMWSYQETVAITLSTFRTVLNLMKQYKDFCFSQSQASVYKIVEEYDPDLMEEIRSRIQEGRWEITASAWVETDKNMPNTESLLRHIEYTKHYLRDVWGVSPEDLQIDFSPDTFGHSANIPELDNFGGVKYMYHCRGLDDDYSLYRWRAPSGRELLVCREQYWYNSGVVPKIGLGVFDIARTCGGFKTGLIVYGVGDHGGGPTRRDIEAAMEMAQWPIFPTMKFGTFREFFREAEAVRDQLPVVEKEMNFRSTGCYTTQSRIKRGNRQAETTLNDAEAMMAFARAETGGRFSQEKHEQAWQKVLYTHFHDILTGSCVQDSREHAMGCYSDALAYAQTQYGKAAAALAAAVDTSSIAVDSDIGTTQAEGAGGGFNMSANCGMPVPGSAGFAVGFNNGVPNPERGCGKVRIFHIFNTLAQRRETVTELTVWDWVGDLRRIQVRDADGNPVEFQLVDNTLEHYWDHKFFRILVRCPVPALGYTTLVLSEAEPEHYPLYRNDRARTEAPRQNYILENGLVRAEFDLSSGCLISLRDLQTGKEYLDARRPVSLCVSAMQRDCTNAWIIGRYLDTQALTVPVNVSGLTRGSLRSRFTAEYKWGSSTLKVTPELYAGEKAVRFCVQADWNETFGETIPLLSFRVPFAFRTDTFLCDVPGGAVRRSPMNMDMPGLQYCAATDSDGTALALIPDSKYGYRAGKDRFAVSLINTSQYPDPYPDRGMHTVNIALAISENDPCVLERTATAFNHSTYFLSANAHPGTLKQTMSFLELQAESSVISAVVPGEASGTFCVRLYETRGMDDRITLRLAKAPAEAVSVDLMGQQIPSDVAVDGTEVSVTVPANSLCQIRITF